MEAIYTTGEVAKYTGVNFRTVIRWIERGELEGYKLPGRGDHRVTHSSLLAFLEKNAIPVPAELHHASKKVLVVDDDAPMANAIARVFKRLGWEVETAKDGFEAGMILAKFEPNVMTLDLKMPFMDGFSVLSMAREKLHLVNLKIIVISAQGEQELKKALDQGATAVLEKPFDNQALKQLVENMNL